MKWNKGWYGGVVLAMALLLALPATKAAAWGADARHPATPARAQIVAPQEGSTFAMGDTLTLMADVARLENPAALHFDWRLDFFAGERTLASFHEDGQQATFVPRVESADPSLYLQIVLAVSDAAGRRDSATTRVYPALDRDPARTIRHGDVLQVTIYAGGEKQEDFSGEVSGAGRLTCPLIGDVQAEGLTTSQLAQEVQRELADSFFVNPQVLVTMKGIPEPIRRKVFVSGEVSKPGAYPFEDGLTVLQACTLAGGFSNFASLGAVRVTRTAGGARKTFVVDLVKVRNGKREDLALQAGDQIDVPHRRF